MLLLLLGIQVQLDVFAFKFINSERCSSRSVLDPLEAKKSFVSEFIQSQEDLVLQRITDSLVTNLGIGLPIPGSRQVLPWPRASAEHWRGICEGTGLHFALSWKMAGQNSLGNTAVKNNPFQTTL